MGPQILIFLMIKIASFPPILILQIKFSVSLFFYLFTFAINLWHRKFVTADITAGFVNNQHGIQRRGRDFDKNLKVGTFLRHSVVYQTIYLIAWKALTVQAGNLSSAFDQASFQITAARLA